MVARLGSLSGGPHRLWSCLGGCGRREGEVRGGTRGAWDEGKVKVRLNVA